MMVRRRIWWHKKVSGIICEKISPVKMTSGCHLSCSFYSKQNKNKHVLSVSSIYTRRQMWLASLFPSKSTLENWEKYDGNGILFLFLKSRYTNSIVGSLDCLSTQQPSTSRVWLLSKNVFLHPWPKARVASKDRQRYWSTRTLLNLRRRGAQNTAGKRKQIARVWEGWNCLSLRKGGRAIGKVDLFDNQP